MQTQYPDDDPDNGIDSSDHGELTYDKNDPEAVGNWTKDKRTKLFFVDLQRIQEYPESDQDKKINEALGQQPEAPKNLIYEEQRKMVDEGVKHAGLSINETAVIQLTLENNYPIEIEVKLKIKHSSVYYYMERGIQKLKIYIFSRWNVNGQNNGVNHGSGNSKRSDGNGQKI